MRIGIDFDGVICDTVPAMIRYAAITHGIALAPLDCIVANGPAGLSSDEHLQLIIDTHHTEFQFEMQPVLDAVDTLRRFGEAHDILVVTARRDEGIENAMRWSDRYGLTSHIGEFVSSGGTTKAALCDSLQLDVLIDDVERNLDGLPASSRPILWHAECYADVKIAPPMVRVRGWFELQEHLDTPH